MWLRRTFTILLLICVLAGSFLISPSKTAQALSVDDYFVYTYDFTFSKTTVTGSETFYVTVSGQATCIQDLPLGVTEAYVESRVVASLGGNEVVLNPNYTISYSGFPGKSGETASASVQVPLSFPSNSAAGIYSITGYITLARVKVLGIWFTITGYLPASQMMGTVTYQPLVQGGGGGGTAGPNPATNLTRFMDSDGLFLEDAEALSIDKVVRLFFPKGTRFSIPGGIGSTVIIQAVEKGKEPVAPENFQIIGQAYSLEPEGATFTPSIQITFAYNETSLPEGAQEKDMVIVWWDSAYNKWVALNNCQVNETANTITAYVEHFTMFAAMVDISPPASFDVSSLSINPPVIKTGESVMITIKATNTGGRMGTLTLVLNINGVEESRKTVNLAAGSTETIQFTVAKDIPATYNIDINGLTGLFMVEPLSSTESGTTPPVTESPPAPDSTSPQLSQPETQSGSEPNQQLEESPQLSKVEPFNWRLLGISVLAGMVLGAIVVFIFWRLNTKMRI